MSVLDGGNCSPVSCLLNGVEHIGPGKEVALLVQSAAVTNFNSVSPPFYEGHNTEVERVPSLARTMIIKHQPWSGARYKDPVEQTAKDLHFPSARNLAEANDTASSNSGKVTTTSADGSSRRKSTTPS